MGVLLSKPTTVDALYGAVLALGGVAGFASVRSVISLVAGVGSGVIVSFAGRGIKSVWSLVLAAVMGRRFVGGGKYMPSGFVAVIAACMFAVNAKMATSGGGATKRKQALDNGVALSSPRGAAGGSGSDDFSGASPTTSPAVGLAGNVEVLSAEQLEFAQSMEACGQAHLFTDWPPPGVNDKEKKALVQQLLESDKLYGGGIKQYVENARALLAASKAGTNPLEGYSPSIPVGVADTHARAVHARARPLIFSRARARHVLRCSL
jgi:hypothetical protein